VRTLRVYCAGIVLGATLAAAVWLYTYRGWENIEHTDPTGRVQLLPPEHVRLTPWWGVYATVALIFVGAGVSLWLLPERRRLIERLATRFVKTPS
jgi:hypothetical protein